MTKRASILTFFAKGLILLLTATLYICIFGSHKNIERKIAVVATAGAAMLCIATRWKWDRLTAENKWGSTTP